MEYVYFRRWLDLNLCFDFLRIDLVFESKSFGFIFRFVVNFLGKNV